MAYNGTTQSDDVKGDREEIACGVVFGRSIRASMVIFQLALVDDDDDDDDDIDELEEDIEEDDEHEQLKVAVLIFNFSVPQEQQQENCEGNQWKERDHDDSSDCSNNNTRSNSLQAQYQSNLRSSFRKCCNLGDLIVAHGGTWMHNADETQTQQQQPNEGTDSSSRCKRCYKVSMPLFSSSSTLTPDFSGLDVKQYLQIKHASRWNIQQWQQVAANCQRERGLSGNSIDMPSRTLAPRRDNAPRNGIGQQQQRRPRRKHSPHPHFTKRVTERISPTGCSNGSFGIRESLHDSDENGDDETQRFNKRVVVKRIQREYLANFLIHMMAFKLHRDGGGDSSAPNESELASDPSSWHTNPTPHHNHPSFQQAIAHLNQGTGVLDVAGGSGHVSMALGLKGIQSTIVDPRAHAGMLPRRDRKLFAQRRRRQAQPIQAFAEVGVNGESFSPTLESNDLIGTLYTDNGDSNDNETIQETKDDQEQDNLQEGQHAVEFRTFRAWFGVPPPGIEWHRHGECQLVCTVEHELVRNCSAIVALHPDEATDAIVDVAVQLRIPFCVVPCCVFARLYPHRRLRRNNSPVCTYQDLLEYLQDKDASIQRSVLPFEGANTILWSIF